jgi:hypothetical protein
LIEIGRDARGRSRSEKVTVPASIASAVNAIVNTTDPLTRKLCILSNQSFKLGVQKLALFFSLSLSLSRAAALIRIASHPPLLLKPGKQAGTVTPGRSAKRSAKSQA